MNDLSFAGDRNGQQSSRDSVRSYAALPWLLYSLLFLSCLCSARALASTDDAVSVVNGSEIDADQYPSLTALLSGHNAYLYINGQLAYAQFFGHGMHGSFSGDGVDCGYADQTCESVSGKVCLIKFQSYRALSPAQQLENCSLGGGIGAVFRSDNSLIGRTDLYDGQAQIPAVFISDQLSDELVYAAIAKDNLTSVADANSSALRTLPLISVHPRVAENILCGAIYLGDQWLVTAAHCVTVDTLEGVRLKLPWEVQASVGAFNLTQDQHLVQSVSEIVLADYQRYGIGTLHDIALLKLAEEPVLQPGFNAVSVPTQVKIATRASADNYSQRSSTVLALGWGSTVVREPDELFSASDTTSATPLAAQLNLTPVDECAIAWRNYLEAKNIPAYSVNVTDTHLCASENQHHRDTCQGDSGGPLFIESGRELELVGITSFGLGCGSAISVPAVYTRVSAYTEWIESVTGIDLVTAVEPDVMVQSDVAIEQAFMVGTGAAPFLSLICLLLACAGMRGVTRHLIYVR